MNYRHPDTKFLESLGVDAPKVSTHGTEDDVRSNLKQLLPNSWRLEGNQLIGQTEMGELRQSISTDYILTGTDDKGLPVFTKIVL